MVRPGHLTASPLVEVEPGVFLGTRAARAYRRCKAAFRKRGKTLLPYNRFSGYRSEGVQNGMAAASRTPKGSQARAHYGLSSYSTVPVAYSPNGQHQDGRALDFKLNGNSSYPNEADRKVFAKYGWFFQFGSNDPNHVRHDNIHGVVPVTRKWCIQNHIWVQPAK